METARPGRFFYRLLGAFLLTGSIPTLFLSAGFGLLSRGVLERSLVERSDVAATLTADSLRSFLDTWAATLAELASDPAIIEYLAADPADRSAELTADVNRRIFSAGRADRQAVYIVPRHGVALGTAAVPETYASSAYAAWGILGALERGTNRYLPRTLGEAPALLAQAAIFGRPHPQEDNPTALALGRAVPATPRPEGPAGTVIIDIKRIALAELLPTAKDAFTELLVVDSSDCVLFDMGRPYREGDFEDTGGLPRGTTLDHGAGRITAHVAISDTLRLIAYQPLAPVDAQSAALRTVTYLSGLLSLATALGLSLLLSRAISDPIHQLVRTMAKVEGGDLSARLLLRRNDELGSLVRSFNRMVSRVQRLVDETIEQHRLIRKAEAAALQSKINPHFLYNTLNTIKSLARLHGVEDIAKISLRLGKLLRSGFAPEGEFVLLEEDLDLARCYLDIQEIRHPGRFAFRLHVEDDVLAVPVPRLVLEPLVENAVVHGLEKRVGPGCLDIYARRRGEDLELIVEDDGVGIDGPRLDHIEDALAQGESIGGGEGSGMALANIHRRLVLLYGPRYGLEIGNRSDARGVRVRLLMPLRSAGGAQ